MIGCSSSYSQEFMHWKFLENKKTDRVKTETVWQYPLDDSTAENKKLFSFHKFDCQERIIALKMYSNDTSYYSYSPEGEKRTISSNGVIKEKSKKTFKYSKRGKVIYEFEPGENGHEYWYYYDSLDREIKMVVSPSDNGFDSHDTIVNQIIYNSLNLDSLRQHYVGGVLKSETRYFYDAKKNLKKRILCKYDENTICDTTFFHYNNLDQKIHIIQQWHKDNDTTTYIDERHWEYDEKGRMIMASDKVSICRWSYDKNGYVKEAKRYNKKNELRFFVKYEYTFWTKKEVRKCKKHITKPKMH
jgi:hypothetical protein